MRQRAGDRFADHSRILKRVIEHLKDTGLSNGMRTSMEFFLYQANLALIRAERSVHEPVMFPCSLGELQELEQQLAEAAGSHSGDHVKPVLERFSAVLQRVEQGVCYR